jgi:hypothetical protein
MAAHLGRGLGCFFEYLLRIGNDWGLLRSFLFLPGSLLLGHLLFLDTLFFLVLLPLFEVFRLLNLRSHRLRNGRLRCR